MPSSSRYLATVRRAMVRPCPRRTWAISWSDSGLPASSAATRSRMFFLTETEETISPESEAMPLWKKYLSSNSPWGVSTYLLVVTRLMVDSCIPMSSPTSRSASGRRWATPLSRKSRWNLTRLCVTFRTAQEGAVQRVDPEARDAFLVEHDDVVVAHLVDRDVGRDVALVGGGEAAAGLGLEPLDLLDRLHDAIERLLERARDLGVAAPLEVLEVLLDDLDGEGVGLGVGCQLEEEAFAHAARGHAGRIESLHQPESALDFLDGGTHAQGDLFHLRPEVAVVVEVADDGLADGHRPRVVGRPAQLLIQVLVEGGARATQVLEGQLLPLLHGHGRPLVGLVEDGGGEVEGQLIRALAIDRGGLLRHGFGGRGFGGQLRHPGLGGGRRVGIDVLRLLLHLFQKRVVLQLFPHHLLELERRQLQQLDRLLQERRHHDPLGLPKGEAHS